jgi:hypothetical protein
MVLKLESENIQTTNDSNQTNDNKQLDLWSAVSWHRFSFSFRQQASGQRGLRKKAPSSRSTPKLDRR